MSSDGDEPYGRNDAHGETRGFTTVFDAPGKLTCRPGDVAHVYGRLALYESPKTGMEIKLQHLEPGLMTTWHTHTCGHGMYVLAGKLHTSHGTFGPGDFVWFEAGTRMEHGTVDEPADLLFITDGPFDIAME